MSTKDILVKAKSFIDTPDKWIKGNLAVAANGDTINNSQNIYKGVCFCSLGAVERASFIPGAYWEDWDALVTAASSELQKQLPEGVVWVHNFNDAHSTKHEDVMALFDRAIAAQP